MNKCGPALVEGCECSDLLLASALTTDLDDIATLTIEILEKKSLCQQDPDGDDENVDVDADSSEYEAALISNAADVFGAMATTLGPDFGQAFGSVLPLISNYSGPKRPQSERSMAVGCLGEIIVGLKAGVTQFTQPLLEIISRGLQDEEPDVRSNAAFAAGVLIENTETDLAPQFGHLLSALQPFFAVPDHSAPPVYNARDNAAGALARMVLKNPGALPLDQVLGAIITILPLTHDTLENKAVYAALFSVFRSQPNLLVPHLDHLLKAFAHVLNPANDDETTEETRAELSALVQHLKAEFPQQVAAAGL